MEIIMSKEELWVICDPNDVEHCSQLLGKEYILSKQSDFVVCAICIGNFQQSQIDKFYEHGAQIIHTNHQSNIENIMDYSDILCNMIKKIEPKLILFPSSEYYRIVASIVSTRFEVGLTADCVDINLDNNVFVFSRAALNSSIIANIKYINSLFCISTVKKNSFACTKCKEESKLYVIEHEFPELHHQKKQDMVIIDKVEEIKFPEVNLDNCRIIFGVGRGVRKNKTFESLKQIAAKFGAEIVGTRACVEDGMINKSRQVGQSGESINPKVYVAFGISGASQHMVGVRNADIIIAINNNKDAPIFSYADYAIVNDVESVIKELSKL